jgi:hypothetical protein
MERTGTVAVNESARRIRVMPLFMMLTSAEDGRCEAVNFQHVARMCPVRHGSDSHTMLMLTNESRVYITESLEEILNKLTALQWREPPCLTNDVVEAPAVAEWRTGRACAMSIG